MKHLVLKEGRVVQIFKSVAGADAYVAGDTSYDVISTERQNVRIGDKASKYGR